MIEYRILSVRWLRLPFDFPHGPRSATGIIYYFQGSFDYAQLPRSATPFQMLPPVAERSRSHLNNIFQKIFIFHMRFSFPMCITV